MLELLNSNQKKRVILDLFLLLVLFMFQWWIFVPLLFVGLVMFPSFLEFVIFALLLELLYGTDRLFFGIQLYLPIGALIVLIIVELVRERLLFDQ